MTNVSFSKSGKAYNVLSYDVVDRRSIPLVCWECNEILHQVETDELAIYDVLVFECRNGHCRTVYIEKEV